MLISVKLAIQVFPDAAKFIIGSEILAVRSPWSCSGISPDTVAHELTTVAARVDSSLSEWRRFDTVRPPRENACSTSVEAATNYISKHATLR